MSAYKSCPHGHHRGHCIACIEQDHADAVARRAVKKFRAEVLAEVEKRVGAYAHDKSSQGYSALASLAAWLEAQKK